MDITIEGAVVRGGKQQMPVDQFCKLIGQHTVTGMSDEPIPDNVRWICEKGEKSVYVIELQPELRPLVWNNSMAGWDYINDEKVYLETGTRHTVATPYVVILIPFRGNKIGGSSERPVRVFYRNSPLQSLDDEVLSSNLTNVLPTNYGRKEMGCMCLDRLDVHSKMDRAEVVNAVVSHLWGGEFNMEYGRNFSDVSHVDQRVSSIYMWEEASKQNPDFVLDVAWPKTGLTIRHLMDQEFSHGTVNLGNLILAAK